MGLPREISSISEWLGLDSAELAVCAVNFRTSEQRQKP